MDAIGSDLKIPVSVPLDEQEGRIRVLEEKVEELTELMKKISEENARLWEKLGRMNSDFFSHTHGLTDMDIKIRKRTGPTNLH